MKRAIIDYRITQFQIFPVIQAKARHKKSGVYEYRERNWKE
jgi:hypothetical protein